MSFIDDILDVLQGPQTWANRLRETIDFVSPEQNEFSAKWIEDSRGLDKKLGIFLFPNVKGNIVQDLDVNSTRYSITFYFDGDNCDLNANAFVQAARERGMWTVTHPVYGFLSLQLMTLKQSTAPVTNGGIITMETEWIESIDPFTLLTGAEAAGLVNTGINDLNDSAYQEFVDNLDTATEALENGVSTVVNAIANATDAILTPLTASVDFLDDTMNIIHNGIQDTLNATVLDVVSLGGQIQSLIQTPALATTSLATSQEYYSELADSLFSDLPDTTGRLSASDKNHLLITQLALNATISAQAKIALLGIRRAQAAQQASVVAAQTVDLAGITTTVTATGDVIEAEPLETRAQAVEAAQDTVAFLKSIVDNLEEKQEDFETEDIDDQYFSQSSSYPDAAQLTAQTAQFLLVSSYDLKVERRFVVDRPRTPLDITAMEYGTLGENDENLDLFIRSNNLTGDEIYMLPAGREVIIYV